MGAGAERSSDLPAEQFDRSHKGLQPQGVVLPQRDLSIIDLPADYRLVRHDPSV